MLKGCANVPGSKIPSFAKFSEMPPIHSKRSPPQPRKTNPSLQSCNEWKDLTGMGYCAGWAKIKVGTVCKLMTLLISLLTCVGVGVGVGVGMVTLLAFKSI